MTEKFKRLSALQNSAKAVGTFWDDYRAQTARQSVDKYNAGFNIGREYHSFEIKARFYAYTGSYGSSSVYEFRRFDAKTIEPYFLRAMDAMAPELFAKAAELMAADAKKLVDGARAEIRAMEKQLDDCLATEDAT